MKPLALALLFFGSLTSLGTSPNAAGAEVRFERHQFSVLRSRGKIYLDGSPATKDVVANHDQRIALIEYFDGLDFDSDLDFRHWTRKLRGTRTYTYDDVVEVSDKGEATRQPLVLLPPDRYAELQPRWNDWLAERARDRQEAERKRQTALAESRRIEALHNYSQIAISKAATHASSQRRAERWNILLVPSHLQNNLFAAGVSFSVVGGPLQSHGYSPGFYTQVSAQNSLLATEIALRQNPGFRVAGAYKAFRRF